MIESNGRTDLLVSGPTFCDFIFILKDLEISQPERFFNPIWSENEGNVSLWKNVETLIFYYVNVRDKKDLIRLVTFKRKNSVLLKEGAKKTIRTENPRNRTRYSCIC